MIKLGLWLLLGVLVLGVAVELLLRWGVGFGDPPLYVADAHTGYRLAPDQNVRRFGNRIMVNQYSMRSGPIDKTPASDTLRILLIGDSIVNGGWWTDQANILSARIEQMLASQLPESYQSVEVLNVSANSWGPRNELGYLQAYGSFEATVIVLLINTDDLFATAPTSVQVGRDRSYPSHRPPLAIIEAYNRFLVKPQPIPELESVQHESGDRVGKNLDALRHIQALAQTTQSQFLLGMTPLLREVQPPGSRDYEITARQRLTTFTADANIPYLDFLEAFQDHSDTQGLYRDHIHLSQSGNTLVSEAIAQTIRQQLATDFDEPFR